MRISYGIVLAVLMLTACGQDTRKTMRSVMPAEAQCTEEGAGGTCTYTGHTSAMQITYAPNLGIMHAKVEDNSFHPNPYQEGQQLDREFVDLSDRLVKLFNVYGFSDQEIHDCFDGSRKGSVLAYQAHQVVHGSTAFVCLDTGYQRTGDITAAPKTF